MQTLNITKKYETYPEYKDSGIEWLGKIPKEWEARKGKFVFQNKKEINRGMKNDNVLSLTMNGVINRDSENNEGLLPSDYQTFQIFEKDDLVFKLIDLENYKTSRVGIVHEKGIMSSAYIRLEAKKDYYSRYFYYLYYHLYIQGIYNFLGSGVRSTLNPTDLTNMIVIIPSLEEQKKVVIILDKKIKEINQIIDKKQRQIKLLQEKRTAVINNVITRGLDKKVELIESRFDWIGKIPKGWEASSLKTLLEMKITDGPHTTPELIEDGVRFISAESIQANNTIDFNKNRGFISEKDHIEFCKKAKPQKGDVFMVKSGATTGRVAIVETNSEFSIWSPLALIRADRKKAIPKYVYFFLQSGLFQDQVKFSWSFGTQQNIGMRVIENLVIVYPSTDHQKKIVEYLDSKLPDFDVALKKVEKSIELLQEFKSSLISNVVTGKIKV